MTTWTEKKTESVTLTTPYGDLEGLLVEYEVSHDQAIAEPTSWGATRGLEDIYDISITRLQGKPLDEMQAIIGPFDEGELIQQLEAKQ